MKQKKLLHLAYLLLWLLSWPASLHASLAQKYTSQKPLIITCDREFPPFEFINENGQPDGLNVDVINKILDYLGIPHTFIMREWNQASRAFEKHQADIIFAASANFPDSLYYSTHSIFSHYQLKVAYRKGTTPLKRISDLTPADTLLMKEDDYGVYYLQNRPHPDFKTVFLSPREALASVSNGHHRYFLWGGAPMQQRLADIPESNLLLSEIDIPSAEMHAVGHDYELIRAIDDAYARFEQKGELKDIYDHWFYPEKEGDNSSPVAIYLIIGIFIVGIVAFILNRLILARVRKSARRAIEMNNMKELALSMSRLDVLEADLSTDHTVNQHGNMLPPKGMSQAELFHHVHPDNLQELKEAIFTLKSGEAKYNTMTLRWNAGTDDEPQWRYKKGHSVIDNQRKDYLFIASQDITHEVEEEKADREMAKRYRTIFDTNIVAMSFYDSEGRLIDINKNMIQLTNFDTQGQEYFQSVRLFDTEQIREDYLPGSRHNFHFCQHMLYPEQGLDKYIEMRIKPIFDDNDDVLYYIVTARDITDERAMYLKQKRMNAQLTEASKVITDYERQLSYMLTNSNMYTFHTDTKKRTIMFSRSLRHIDYTITFEEYLAMMYEDDRAVALKRIKDPKLMLQPFNTVHHFKSTPLEPSPCWYAISATTLKDTEGRITGHFGIIRDVTRLMENQERLRHETQRAKQSGLMKSAFLANMTHEIRTPLNAIVGFSDLLQVVDDPQEQQEFIRIIRNNCDMLLRLINDILEASNMGQALAIKPEDVDFAQVFQDICQTLAQRVDEPGVEFITDQPYDTFLARLDKGRVQQVITNFVTNAVKYTHEGHIRVGYREKDDGIYLYCEDTGAGIPEDKQDSVFERFVKLDDNVQGTGLGLSICRAIAERSGGRIGVKSQGIGHGSTFWLWIPRFQ